MNKFEDEDQTMRRHAEAVDGRKRTVDGRGTKATGESTSIARKTPELGSSIEMRAREPTKSCEVVLSSGMPSPVGIS